MTADGLDNPEVQPITALTCNQLLTRTAHHVGLSTFGFQVNSQLNFWPLFALRQAPVCGEGNFKAKEQTEGGHDRSAVVSQTGRFWSEKVSNTARIDCQTTANHDRKRKVTTDLVSMETLISRGFCCVVINGDRSWNHS